MTMEFNPTRLYWATQDGEPIDLSGHVKTVTMHRVDPEEPFLSTFGMKPITLRLKGRATPQLYRLLLGRTHCDRHRDELAAAVGACADTDADLLA